MKCSYSQRQNVQLEVLLWFIGKSQGEQEQSRQQRISMLIVVDFPTWYPLRSECYSVAKEEEKGTPNCSPSCISLLCLPDGCPASGEAYRASNGC
jgi:hypothetical protein